MANYSEPRVYGATSKRFAPGEEVRSAEFLPGDFILTHGKSFFSRLIRFGQGLRFWGADRRYTWWNHAAILVSQEGDLIEALGAGVERSNISKYRKTEYHLVRLGSELASDQDRHQAVAFAEWSLGQKYGWLTIVSISISLLVGGKFTFGFDGQSICSGLVARALERTNAIFDRSPSHIMPADLAKYFKVTPPPIGTDRGEPQAPRPRSRGPGKDTSQGAAMSTEEPKRRGKENGHTQTGSLMVESEVRIIRLPRHSLGKYRMTRHDSILPVPPSLFLFPSLFTIPIEQSKFLLSGSVQPSFIPKTFIIVSLFCCFISVVSWIELYSLGTA